MSRKADLLHQCPAFTPVSTICLLAECTLATKREVSYWHNPAALTSGRPVSLLG